MSQKIGFDPSVLLDELERMHKRVAVLEAEAAKKEADEFKFSRLVELSADGIVVCDEEGNVVSWNHGAEVIFGINRQQALGKKLWDLQFNVVPAEARALELKLRVKKMLEKFLRTGKAPLAHQYIENDFEKPDGTRRVTETVFFPIPSGKGFMACGIVRDITARKQAEEQLLHFQILAEASRDIILFINEEDGRILDANHAALQAYGYVYYELLLMSISDLATRDFDHVSRKGVAFEDVHRRKNGETFYAEVNITGAEFHHRNVYLCVIRDITEQKEAERALLNAKTELEERVAARTIELQRANAVLTDELNERRRAQAALQASEEEYRNLVENMNDLICEVDPQVRFTYVSPQYRVAFGYDPEELIGREVKDFCYTDDIDDALRKFENLLREQTSAHGVWRFRHKNGEWRWLECNGRTYQKPSGEIGVVVISRDITEQKHLEDQLKENQSNLLALIENTDDPIVLRDKQGILLLFNQAYAVLFKKTHGMEPRPGMDMQRLLAHPDKLQMMKAKSDVLHGKVSRIEFIQDEGREGERHYELVCTPVWKEKEIIGFTEFFHNVTARVLTERTLTENEDRYRTLADFTYDWETWMGPDGNWLYISPSCERISGYRVDEFLRNPGLFYEIVYPEDRELFLQHTHDENVGRTKTSLVLRIRRRDGAIVWIEHVCQPVFRRDGTRYGRRASNRDITEQKNLLETLERRVTDRTRELKMMYELSAVSSHAKDLQDFLSRALELALKAFPGSSGAIHEVELRHHKLMPLVLLPEADNSEGKSFVDSFAAYVFKNGQRVEVDLSRDDLSAEMISDLRFPVEKALKFSACFGIPIWVNGTIWGVVSIYQSRGMFTAENIALISTISEQIGSGVETAQLRQKSRQAAILDERQRMARNLHDSVNQLMYSLVLSAQAGQNYLLSDRWEELTDSLQAIAHTAEQALQEMRLLIYELRPVELEKRNLIEALHHRLEYVEKRAGFIVKFDASESIKIPEDIKEAYYHIAQEVLNNVIKHAQAKNVIIRVKMKKGCVIMEIVDDGVGFDIDRAQRGMGLDSIKIRAEAVDGSLTIASEPMKGTKVVISTPLRKQRNLNVI